jgi:hypothetical protein
MLASVLYQIRLRLSCTGKSTSSKGLRINETTLSKSDMTGLNNTMLIFYCYSFTRIINPLELTLYGRRHRYRYSRLRV